MSHHNPTTLKLGMTGQLFDRTYTVKGRVVLSVDDADGRWHWNEFFLKDATGAEATLVYETTEAGLPVWRLFYYFEPEKPVTLSEAAQQAVGASILLGEYRGTVDLHGESTVRHIEGEAPEGVEVADKSAYFNATGEGQILVVSWAQGEVEHYLGQTLAPRMVEKAFGLQTVAMNRFTGGTTQSLGPARAKPKPWLWFVMGLLILGIVVVCFTGDCSGTGRFRPRELPKALLKQDEVRTIQGRQYQVLGAAIIEFGTARATRLGRWYELTDPEGKRARLLVGCHAERDVLWWAEPDSVQVIPEVRGEELARLAVKEKVTLAGTTYVLAESYRIRVLRREGGALPEMAVNTITYGFVTAGVAESQSLIEWTAEQSQCTKVKTLSSLSRGVAVTK